MHNAVQRNLFSIRRHDYYYYYYSQGEPTCQFAKVQQTHSSAGNLSIISRDLSAAALILAKKPNKMCFFLYSGETKSRIITETDGAFRILIITIIIMMPDVGEEDGLGNPPASGNHRVSLPCLFPWLCFGLVGILAKS